ncbi:MAG: hypothetical protein KQI78_16155 [Deltaproteobacteria bacterium]|nr:hypothetical protein [Deltaproteobacteria bacterium]
MTKGLDDTLSQNRVPLALHVECMDTKRVASPNYDENLAAFYQKKFQGITFAVIVCSDNNAVQFMAVHGRTVSRVHLLFSVVSIFFARKIWSI